MRTFVLTDVSHDAWVESFAIEGEALGSPAFRGCSVAKRRLHGGRREGVDLIEIDNGALAFSIIPTRGMNIWKASCGGDRIGWDSPTTDGPVNPAYVNLLDLGGIGWLAGFDELLARCGLMSNGAPYRDGDAIVPLHGRVANIPASYVAIHVDENPPYEIVVEGRVDESFLFGAGVRMTTRISTVPGSKRLTVRDEFENLKDQPVEMQILYHWNFGPPYLEEGSRFVAPIKTLIPRDSRAVEGLASYDVYGPPEPGFAEQAYFFELLADGDAGKTVAMLRNQGGDKGVALRYPLAQLPCFTLWKNTAGARDGYVTGLEPAANYPNPRPFEKARGRVLTLPVNGRHVAETVLEALDDRSAVAKVEAEIGRLQAQAAPVDHSSPREPFAAEG
ncbi:MAG: aldose 1-epimerase family protein [Paludisphaera borealis]|uniref:aldose 1-epimerase family protein n=1 Tax=Paludisphaera borealis TaxID=1387353 RepID=UPI0028522882|nr:aldose 1-epimerase family protein [Paludisphaera borealis]MDR3619431.1 aldose 1-epimerase family protein [Paludisphaera borealis]